MKIGIGITTRNRADILEIALHYHHKFKPAGDVKIVVVDDDSSYDVDNESICDQYPNVYYKRNFSRKGVARSKNECLKQLRDCDFIFLLDDDAFPQKEGWTDEYIRASQDTGIEHFVYIGVPYSDEATANLVNNTQVWTSPRTGGVLMFLTKNALQKVGGYNPAYKEYGYEHSGYSNRMFRAGLTKGYGPYVSLPQMGDFMYSMDFDKDTDKTDVDKLMKRENFRSSVHGENLNPSLAHNHNVYVAENNGKIKVNLF